MAPSKVVFPCRSKGVCEAAGREIVESEGRMWAVCTCAAEEPPHSVNRNELQRYQLDTAQFVNLLTTRNELGGKPSEMSAGLWFLGENDWQGQRLAWVLALLRDQEESVPIIESLRMRLPTSFQSIVTMTMVKCAPEVEVRLNGLGVFPCEIPTSTDLILRLETLGSLQNRRATDPGSWPDNYFQDEEGVWLTAKILTERYEIPDSRLKTWREQGCPALQNQRFAAKKIGGVGWVYFRMHVHQIANHRDDLGKVESKLDLAARLNAASQLKRTPPDSH